MLPYLLLAAALSLSLATGHDLARTAAFFVDGLTAWTTIQLLGIVTLIEMLTVLLQQSGSLDAILTGLRSLARDPRVLMAIVPSLLGVFPVPGGAIMSAPMVGVYGDELAAAAHDKSAINMYFRHIWDQIVPFKSHLILSAVVLNIPLFTLIAWQLPVTLVAFAIGYWHLLTRRLTFNDVPLAGQGGPSRGRSLLLEASPLIIPLVLAPALGIDFLFAIALGLIFGLIVNRASLSTIRVMVSKGIHVKLLLTLASVMVFKAVVEGTGVAGQVAGVAADLGVPPTLLVVVLPFAAGLATGLEVAVVATTFPLLMALVPAGAPLLPYAVVMMLANAVGSFLAPAHLCMVACNEYFCADYAKVVRLNLVPMVARLGTGVLLAWAMATYWVK